LKPFAILAPLLAALLAAAPALAHEGTHPHLHPHGIDAAWLFLALPVVVAVVGYAVARSRR
jgi:hypothetical protein